MKTSKGLSHYSGIHAVLVGCILLFALSGCGPSIKATVYDENRAPKPVGCKLDIYNELEVISGDAIVLGRFSVEDSLLSFFCGEEAMMDLIKQKACEAGADAVRIFAIREPSEWSTCWRASAIFIAYPYDTT